MTVKGISYPLRFSTLGHFERSEGKDKLKDNSLGLIETRKGERALAPNLGTRSLSELFRDIDTTTCTIVSGEIEEAMADWEPRVLITEIDCKESIEEPGRLTTTIRGNVRGSDEELSLGFDLGE